MVSVKALSVAGVDVVLVAVLLVEQGTHRAEVTGANAVNLDQLGAADFLV